MKKTKYYRASRKRSFTKALSFRIISITTDLIVIYIFTRNESLSLKIALGANLTSTIMYYLHERIWNRTHWGKN